jgi:hypothetical protein
VANPVGVSVAFDDPVLEPDPTWTDLAMLPGISVLSWTVDRGRTSELDQTGTGTATVTLVDRQSVLDPRNVGGTLAGRINPMRQAAIVLYDPVNGNQGTVFRGFVEDWRSTPDVTERWSTVEIDLVDAFAYLSNTLLRPGEAGDAVPVGAEGNVFYEDASTPRDRMLAVLADANWPSELSQIFTGNVTIQETVYSPNTQALAALRDAADAEFPGVGNLYVGGPSAPGTVVFHGRMARFRPDVAEYQIAQWKVGDASAFTADSNTVVASELTFSRGVAGIVNSALAAPQNIAGTSLAGQLTENAASIGTYGYQSFTAEDLLTGGGIASNVGDPVAETKLYSDYYVQNMATASTRLDVLAITSPSPRHPTADRRWTFLTQVDISDLVTVTSVVPGTGGSLSADDFFIEGLHYSASAQGTSHHHVELTLDTSPRSSFGTFTFGTYAPL